MNETLKNENSIREYLLGRVSDETRLAEFEELLFLDEDFCSLAELAEDSLINDFVFGRLDETDSADFLKTLENNRERQEKIAVTKAIKEKAAAQTVAETEAKPSFFESLKAFFQKPLNVGAVAVLLIAVVLISFFVLRKPSADELAGLKTIYIKERPTETRLSEFDYAPLTVTRGAAEEREKNKLRIIENEFRIAVEKNPSANTHHALGVFLLTQRKFDEAIDELEKAVKLNENDAKIRNDLGSAYFEKAKTAPDEKKLETLAKALENFSQAVDSDANLLAALFNKALCLQELRLYNQAKDAWNLYLEKDKNSGWADEARKNLERLEQLKSTSKTKEKVLDDFLVAYRNRDAETVWKVNSQTREMISGVWLPDQLSRRFIEAKIRGNDAAADESIEALKFIGNLEKTRNADFFVAEMADFYANANILRLDKLLKAKNLFAEGYNLAPQSAYAEAKAHFVEALEIFSAAGNESEEKLAEHWIAFCESNQSDLDESSRKFVELIRFAAEKRYKWLKAICLMRLSTNYLKQNSYSKGQETLFESARVFEEIDDYFNLQKVNEQIAQGYNEIGDSAKSFQFLSKVLFAENFYYRSNFQILRNNSGIADSLFALKLPKSAISFARENVKIAREKSSDGELLFDSQYNLAKVLLGDKNYPDALGAAEENQKTAENLPDEKSRKLKIIYNSLLLAQINRQANNCPESVRYADLVLNYLNEIPKSQIYQYSAHKEKLFCFKAEGDTANVLSEIEILSDLFEKYRTQIIEENSRNVFFDKEQSVTDAIVEFEIVRNDSVRAFEYAESAKARSLLDFVEGNADLSADEIKFGGVAKSLSLSELRNRIDPQTQIIEYAVLPEETVVWVVDRERFESVRISLKSEDLNAKLKDYLNILFTDKNNRTALNKLAGELYDLLIKPVMPYLDKNKTICIVPDKSLFSVPFSALWNAESGKYLIEDFALQYAPSASIFVIKSESAKQREVFSDESLLAVGNPNFDKKENPTLADLRSAVEEAEQIAAMYPNHQLLLVNKATKANILRSLPEKNIFHFAGHYIVGNDLSNSKLLLAGDGNGGEVRTFEIARLRLPNSKFVILSACDTGVEKIYLGEGAIGIARIFLAIGAPAVVSSFWKVDSEATREFMILFHRNRREKSLSIAESLRQAQTSFLKGTDEKYVSPYFWAAFSHVGGKTAY